MGPSGIRTAELEAGSGTEPRCFDLIECAFHYAACHSWFDGFLRQESLALVTKCNLGGQGDLLVGQERKQFISQFIIFY